MISAVTATLAMPMPTTPPIVADGGGFLQFFIGLMESKEDRIAPDLSLIHISEPTRPY